MARLISPDSDRPFIIVERDGEDRLLDLPQSDMRALFERHGAILFRGFAADLGDFSAYTDRWCAASVFNESPDRLLLDEAHNIQSVNGGSDAFPLHPELSREPWKPDICFFHCLTPPPAGGETTICDGIAIVRELPREVRAGLQDRRLVYAQPVQPWHLRFWFGTETPPAWLLAQPPAECPYEFRMIDGHLMRLFSRPVFHKPMFSDAQAFGNFLLFARYYLGRSDFPMLDDGHAVPSGWVDAIKAVGDRLTIPIRWQRGDLLLLDNSRFLHGRNAISDPHERLIASYFGYLREAPTNAEEPADPVWRRRPMFRPPQPPARQGLGSAAKTM